MNGFIINRPCEDLQTREQMLRACAAPAPVDPERAAHRAAVEAGYAELRGYVEKYGADA